MESSAQNIFKRELLVDKIVAFIRESIVLGKLKPGQKINERDFTDIYGFSRSPLREALRILDVEGLVKIIPHKGAFIEKITPADLIEIYEMRMLIEPYGVQMACKNRNPESLQELEQIINVQRLDTEKNMHTELLVSSNAFHLKLLEMAGNQKLMQMYSSLIRPIRFILFMVYKNRENAKKSLNQHSEFLEFFRSGKPHEVKFRFKKHLEWGFSTTYEALELFGEVDQTAEERSER